MLKPDMEAIEEQFRSSDRPSAVNSRAMADYIYSLETNKSDSKRSDNSEYAAALELHNEYLDGYRTKWSITFNEWLRLRLNSQK